MIRLQFIYFNLSPGGGRLRIWGGSLGFRKNRGGGARRKCKPSIKGGSLAILKGFSFGTEPIFCSNLSFRVRGLSNYHYSQISMYILTHLLKFNSCFVQIVTPQNELPSNEEESDGFESDTNYDNSDDDLLVADLDEENVIYNAATLTFVPEEQIAKVTVQSS